MMLIIKFPNVFSIFTSPNCIFFQQINRKKRGSKSHQLNMRTNCMFKKTQKNPVQAGKKEFREQSKIYEWKKSKK